MADPTLDNLNTRVTNLEGLIPGINQQIGTLTAKVNQANGAATAALTPATTTPTANVPIVKSTSTSTGTTYTEVNPYTVLFNSTGASVSWTTLSFSNIPAGATRVILNGWSDHAEPDNANVQLNFRRDVNSVTRLAMTSHSVTGNYSVTSAFWCEVPLSANNTIDYEIVNGYFTTLEVRLIEYVIG